MTMPQMQESPAGDSTLPTALSTSANADAAPPANFRDTLFQWGARLEKFLDAAGDRLNPILVKEARQSMKSKQFSVTFSLLLILSWMWTAIFVAFSVPDIFYEAWGNNLLIGYIVILSIPLFIVVPFAAFRSLAAETEDGTFELLSITSLSARQIVTGKLGSAILQMMVYYSALAPSIAFTYLLKGVDILSIGLLLLHTFVISVVLSILGLLAATITRARHWQVLVSVVLIGGLLFATFIADYCFIGLSIVGLPFDMTEFWVSNLALLNFWVAVGALFLIIASGQISFASDNRSTPVRLMLLLIQANWIGWMMFCWRWVPNEDASEACIWVMIYFAAIFWAIAGALLTGENAQLSPRAKRNLPQTLIGRVLLTWFNPGSASGYTFALLNLAGVIGTVLLVYANIAFFSHPQIQAMAQRSPRWVAAAIESVQIDKGLPADSSWFWASLAAWGYVAGYLGSVRLLTSFARKYAPLNMLAVFLLQLLVVLMGAIIPFLLLTIQTIGDPASWYYSELQLPNWLWTMWELTWPTSRVVISKIVPASVFGIGGVIFLVNLLAASVEVEQVRTLAPARVLEDDASLRPQEQKKKKNPWDDG
jgi:hypothetical protein